MITPASLLHALSLALEVGYITEIGQEMIISDWYIFGFSQSTPKNSRSFQNCKFRNNAIE